MLQNHEAKAANQIDLLRKHLVKITNVHKFGEYSVLSTLVFVSRVESPHGFQVILDAVGIRVIYWERKLFVIQKKDSLLPGKKCVNGGTLDLKTCECKCRKIFTGDTCKTLKCPPKDSWFCGTTWDKSYCRRIITAQFECPYMCNICKK